MNMIQRTFTELLQHYTDDKGLINELWTEIAQHYSDPKRHYHSLQHLEDVLAQLAAVKDDIQNWNALLFALYYHDIVYNAERPDNEEKSAALAAKRMQQLSVPRDIIALCTAHIAATRSHVRSDDKDTNYFTDADLSILGKDREAYLSYCKNVRKEYAIYPELVYNAGRKKVLTRFLTMDRIFKTDFFYNKFEISAKQNLQAELALL